VKKGIINIDTAIQDMKNRTKEIPPSLRPRKSSRPASSRTPEEARNLARAVYNSVKRAEDEGYIVKVPGGYKMSWNPEKK